MTLAVYTKAGDSDCFTYDWLEQKCGYGCSHLNCHEKRMKTMTMMPADSRRGKTGPQRATKLAKGFSCLALAATVTTGYAFTSDRSYDQLGQAVVASFECATLAAHAKYRDEEVRLIAYGLSTGRAFVEAYRAGRVPTADFNRVDLILPQVLRAWSIHQKLNVPVDFAVGGIYQETWSRTTSDLGDRSRKMKERQSDYSVWAQADFRQKNCSLVGK